MMLLRVFAVLWLLPLCSGGCTYTEEADTAGDQSDWANVKTVASTQECKDFCEGTAGCVAAEIRATICYVYVVNTTKVSKPGNTFLAKTCTSAGECEYVRACYYTNWSQYRQAPARFVPSSINATLCTHILYAFLEIDASSKTIVYREWNDNVMLQQLRVVRQANPDLKLLAALGGWQRIHGFISVTQSETDMQTFAVNAINFLRDNGLDGLDIDWEYPSMTGHKTQHTQLMETLRTKFDEEVLTGNRKRLILAAAVSAGQPIIDSSYNIPLLSSYVDFLSIMTYDFQGAWTFPPEVDHHSPLYNPNSAIYYTDYAMRYWRDQGADPRKMLMGMPTYGRHFRLSDPSQTAIRSPFSTAGSAGTYTRMAGSLSYYEICQLLEGGFSTVRVQSMGVPYSYGARNGHTEWVGYDDVDSLRQKLQYVKDNGYGGAMVWSLDMDDFTGFCGKEYPLVSELSAALTCQSTSPNSSPATSPTSTITTSPTTTSATTTSPTTISSTTSPTTTSPTTTSSTTSPTTTSPTTTSSTTSPTTTSPTTTSSTTTSPTTTSATTSPTTTSPTITSSTTSPTTTSATTTSSTTSPTTTSPTTTSATTSPTTMSPTTTSSTTSPTTTSPTITSSTTSPTTTSATTTSSTTSPTTTSPTTTSSTTSPSTTSPTTTSSTTSPTTTSAITTPLTTNVATSATTTSGTTSATTEPSTTTTIASNFDDIVSECASGTSAEWRRSNVDCAKFYRCVTGSVYTFTCTSPLVFDLVHNTCNWAWAVSSCP